MNKTIRILSAIFLTAVASASFAKTEYFAIDRIQKIGDKIDQGYLRSLDYMLPDSFRYLKRNRLVIQFNVRSTNKSRYNAIYLERYFDTIDQVGGDFCEPVEQSSSVADDFSSQDTVGDVPDKPVLVTYLPYSPHEEVYNNEKWFNGWRSVHAVVRVPDWMMENNYHLGLRVCSRDKDGNVAGDLDDFEIKDIVIHYEVEDDVEGDYSFYGRYTD